MCYRVTLDPWPCFRVQSQKVEHRPARVRMEDRVRRVVSSNSESLPKSPQDLSPYIGNLRPTLPLPLSPVPLKRDQYVQDRKYLRI